MTNYEQIKQMTVNEMAEVMYCAVDNICFSVCKTSTDNKFQCPYETEDPKNCTRCIVMWLESEVEAE